MILLVITLCVVMPGSAFCGGYCWTAVLRRRRAARTRVT